MATSTLYMIQVVKMVIGSKRLHQLTSSKNLLARVANSLLSQELKLCFSDTKFTKAPYTKKDTRFFLDTK